MIGKYLDKGNRGYRKYKKGQSTHLIANNYIKLIVTVKNKYLCFINTYIKNL